MGYDSSDILGGETLPVGRNQPPGLWSSIPDFAKTSLYSVCLLASVLVIRDLYYRFMRWRERSYRKATRRRHGIPDSDKRPFNVAYAAAVNARQDHDGLNKRIRKLSQQASATPQPTRELATSVPGGLNSYPIRAPSIISRNRNSVGPFTTYDAPSIAVPSPLVHNNNINLNGITGFAPPETSQRSRKNSRNYSLSARPSKHPLDGEDESETDTKKFRVDHPDIIQEDDEMEDLKLGEPLRIQRGSKRLASPDNEDGPDATRTTRGDKRARKVSRDHTPQELLDEPMEDTEVLSDSVQSPRGTKRDRGEEGMGDEDSVLGDSDEKHRRRRQRRTVSGKKTPRGQKRGRDSRTVETDSEGEFDQSSIRRSRKKRGKKALSSDEEEDISMDDILVSSDPLCKGRVVGEEWELGGTRYKVGPNGDRMRQTLVRRKRQKYPMPVDSEHPDKDVMIEVIVESWLTEDEYRIAKERFELAWQDPPYSKEIAEADAPGILHTPVKGGKNLLWSSTTTHPESPVLDRRPFRTSVTANIGLHLNPLQQSQYNGNKGYNGKGRITAAVNSPIAASPDTPKLKQSKSYSKWEKQDLEAEAMSKIRQRLQEQNKATEEQNKPVLPQAPTPTLSVTTSAPSVPSFLAPSSKPTETNVAANLTSTAAASAAKEAPKSFGFGAPTPAGAAPTPPPLNFARPSAPLAAPNTSNTPASASTPATGASVPNFFGAKATITPVSTPVAVQTPTTLFGFPPTNASTTTVKPSFSFPASSSTAFGAPTEQPKKVEPVTSPAANGFFGVKTPDAAADPAPKAPAGDQPKFAFGMTSKPATPAPSPFGGSQQQQPSAAINAFGAQPQMSQASAPKFGFGVTSGASQPQPKVDTGASSSGSGFSGFPGPSAFPSVTTPSNTLGSAFSKETKPTEAQKPPAFSFGISSTPSPSKPTASSFGNGAPSAAPASPAPNNGFGAASNASAGANKPSFSFAAPTGTFGGGASPAPAAKPTFAFGATSSTSSSPSSPFGGAVPATAKPSFSFGNTATTNNPNTPTSTPTSATDTSKPNFSFGPPAANPNAGHPQQQQQQASFNFGGSKPANPSFAFGAPSGDKPSGATPTPSAFGFGAAGTSSNTFSFGSKPEEKK